VAYLGLGVLAIVASGTMWLKLPGDIHGDRRTIRERLSVLKVPGMPPTLLTSGLVVLAMFIFFNYLAPATTDLLGLDHVLLPLVMFAFGIGAVLGNLFGGRLADRIGRLAALAPAAVPLSASLNLTSMNIGGAFSALVGGLVLEHLDIAWLGPIGAIAAVAALVVAYLAPDHR